MTYQEKYESLKLALKNAELARYVSPLKSDFGPIPEFDIWKVITTNDIQLNAKRMPYKAAFFNLLCIMQQKVTNEHDILNSNSIADDELILIKTYNNLKPILDQKSLANINNLLFNDKNNSFNPDEITWLIFKLAYNTGHDKIDNTIYHSALTYLLHHYTDTHPQLEQWIDTMEALPCISLDNDLRSYLINNITFDEKENPAFARVNLLKKLQVIFY